MREALYYYLVVQRDTGAAHPLHRYPEACSSNMAKKSTRDGHVQNARILGRLGPRTIDQIVSEDEIAERIFPNSALPLTPQKIK